MLFGRRNTIASLHIWCCVCCVCKFSKSFYLLFKKNIFVCLRKTRKLGIYLQPSSKHIKQKNCSGFSEQFGKNY